MAWAQFVQSGMQFQSGAFDSAAAGADAEESKKQGYLTADANETRVRANSAQQLGEQRADAVQSGFDANSGSLATVQSQSAGNAELDALTQRYKGQMNAWTQDQIIARGQQKLDNVINPMSTTKWGRFLSGFSIAGQASRSYSHNGQFFASINGNDKA